MIDKYLRKKLNRINKESETINQITTKISKMEEFDPELEKLLLKIKRELIDFNIEELFEFTKNVIPNIHFFLSYEKYDKLKIYCEDRIIKKILDNKNKYRITQNIDNVRVSVVKLTDCFYENQDFYIKLKASIFFYDEVANNSEKIDYSDKYWNDVWFITYKKNESSKIQNKCPYCGASMDYNEESHMFKCKYCRNSLLYSAINWKITDIDVNPPL